MTYDGHRVRQRRRMAATQAAPTRQAPEDDAVDLNDAGDLALDVDDAAPVPTSLPEPAPPEPEPAPPPAPTTAAEFVAALAVAMTGVPLAEHTAEQLGRLRAVLAVAAPGIVLTTPEPDPREEPPVSTTTAEPPEPAPPVDPSAEPAGTAEPVTLDAAFAQLGAERAARIAAEAERDAAAAHLEQLRASPARAAAEAEAAIAADQAATTAADQRTTGVLAATLVTIAQRALLGYGQPAGVAEALALTAAVPNLAERTVRTIPGQHVAVDESAATHLLRTAARTTGASR